MNSSSSSGSGRSAAGGSSAGSRAGTRVGMSAPGAVRPAPRPAAFEIAPARPPAHPALKWLAIGGWATFAAEWLLMLLVLTSLVSRGGRVNAEAAPVAAPQAPVVRAPAAPAPALTPAPAPSATAPVATTPGPTPTATPPAATTGPDVLGLNPGPGHTVVLLDAIERSEPWLDRAKGKLIEGLTRPGPAGATFSVAVMNDGNGHGLINRPLTYGPAAAAPLGKALDPLGATGSGGLSAGLEAAGKLGADQIVFITSRDSKWGGAVSFLEKKLLVNGKRIRLHVVQVNDQPVSELRAFVTGANGGQYLQVAPGSL